MWTQFFHSLICKHAAQAQRCLIHVMVGNSGTTLEQRYCGCWRVDENTIAISGLKLYATRKGVPDLRGPALGCMSAADKTSAYIVCKDNCIGPHGQES